MQPVERDESGRAALVVRVGRLARWVLVAAVALTGVTGCVSMGPVPVVRMYEGQSQAPGSIAVVKNPEGLTVTWIDNYRVSKNMRFGRGRVVNRIELLPGKHRIKVSKEVPDSVFYDAAYNAVNKYRLQEATLEVEAVAGKTYIMGEDVTMQPNYKWTPWVREAGSP